VWQRHLPTQLREQPDGGLLDKLVFGVGVGAHERAMNQSNEQMTADSTSLVSKANPLRFRVLCRSTRF
jgi:hypothetical protein